MTTAPPTTIHEEAYTLHRGNGTVLVSLPHVGTLLPADQHARYQPRALQVEDTDWYLDQLYDFARDLDLTLLVARHSRYLIDLNRPPEDTPMYPGRNNTELCPTRFFTGEPLYRDGAAPDAAEIARRVARYWRPYHDTLAAELARLKAAHGHAVLYDGHSIRSRLPWLFDGELPALNLGTADGSACAPELRAAASAVLAGQTRYPHVVDGRFKGGFITRRHGRPADGVHALQMEMCWHCIMEEAPAPPFHYDTARADAVRAAVLRPLLQSLADWRPGARP